LSQYRQAETMAFAFSCLRLIKQLLPVFAGKPIWYRTKREAEIASTNWTVLADEWIAAKARAAERMDVALLPFNERFRKLPPTAETVVINSTNLEQLERVSFFHLYLHTKTRARLHSCIPNGNLSLSITQDLFFVINWKLSLMNGISATRNCFFSSKNWLRTYVNDMSLMCVVDVPS